MSEGAPIIRLSKAAREFNIGVSTIVEFLSKKGLSIEKDPNFKLSNEMYIILVKEFAPDKHVKEEAKKIGYEEAKQYPADALSKFDRMFPVVFQQNGVKVYRVS